MTRMVKDNSAAVGQLFNQIRDQRDEWMARAETAEQAVIEADIDRMQRASRLRDAFTAHRALAFVACDETCFCWTVDGILSEWEGDE